MKQKIHKFWSILLILALGFSACICPISTVSAANEVTYYVSQNGSDTNDGKTANTALATVEKAVALAAAKGCGAGDNVYVKAAGTITWGTLEAYAFILNVESEDVNNLAAVTLGRITGDVVLDNIKVNNNTNFNLSGNNFTLGAGVQINSSAKIDLAGGNQIITKTQNIIINNNYSSDIIIGNNSMNGATWEKDLNIVVNNAKASPRFSFATYWAAQRLLKVILT